MTVHEVNFNAGEALDHTDLNNLQRFRSTMIADGILSPMAMTTGLDSGGPSVSLAYAIGNAGGVVSSGLSLLSIRGIILQRTDGSNPDNLTPRTLAYNLLANEIGSAIGAFPVPVTDPRIDRVEIKLEELAGDSTARDFKDAITGALSSVAQNKKLSTSITIQRTPGTEAPSPVAPAATAGFVTIALVQMDPGDAFIEHDNIHDERIPLGLSTYVAAGLGAWSYDPADWTISAATGLISPADPLRTAWLFAPPGGQYGRLVSVGLTVSLAAASTSTIELIQANTAGVSSVIQDMTSLFTPGSGVEFQKLDLSSLNTAVWGNGRKSLLAMETNALPAGHRRTMALRITCQKTGDDFRGAEWKFAG